MTTKGTLDKNPWTIYSHAFDQKEMGKSSVPATERKHEGEMSIPHNPELESMRNGEGHNGHAVVSTYHGETLNLHPKSDFHGEVRHPKTGELYGTYRLSREKPSKYRESGQTWLHTKDAPGKMIYEGSTSNKVEADQAVKDFHAKHSVSKGLKSTAIRDLHHPQTSGQTRAAIDHLKHHADSHTPKEQAALAERVRRAAKKHGLSMSEAKGPTAAKKDLERKAKMAKKSIDAISDLMKAADDAEKGYPLGEGPKKTKSGVELWMQPPPVKKEKKEYPINLDTAPQFIGKDRRTSQNVEKSADDEGYDTVTHKQIHADLESHPDKPAAIRRAAHYHSSLAFDHMSAAEHAPTEEIRRDHYAAARANRDAQHDMMQAHDDHVSGGLSNPDESLHRAKLSSHRAEAHNSMLGRSGGARVPEYNKDRLPLFHAAQKRVSKAMTARAMPRMPRALRDDTYRSATAVMTRDHSGLSKDLHTGPLTPDVIEQVKEDEYRRTHQMPIYKSCGGCGRTFMAKSMDDACPTCSVNKSQFCSKCHHHLIKSRGGVSCPICG